MNRFQKIALESYQDGRYLGKNLESVAHLSDPILPGILSILGSCQPQNASAKMLSIAAEIEHIAFSIENVLR